MENEKNEIMRNTYLIKQATLVNEGKQTVADVLIQDGIITKIANQIEANGVEEIDATGKYLIPGCIDDQVHFREPGLTHKANIGTESAAAVAGGITTFMEMPNTVPNTLTQELLQDKYDIAAQTAYANYSFFMGASNDNIEEVLRTNPKDVCGVKVFMGSSTGNMLVDKETTLNAIFSQVPMLIATHCEDEQTVRANLEKAKAQYGENIPIEMHPIIRSEEACYLSSSLAVGLAKKHGAKLHVLHISTAKELELFDNTIPLSEKKITAEACVHHLWFTDKDYAAKGNFIKWNPAVKTLADREGIWEGLLSDKIDVIATDHAPHTIEEKSNSYLTAPSGGPLVQHALLAMLEKMEEGRISFEKVVEKMAHNPAILFQIDRRGFIREGYHADLVLVEKKNQEVTKDSLLYMCGWSPFEGQSFQYSVAKTFINGAIAYADGKAIQTKAAQRVLFAR